MSVFAQDIQETIRTVPDWPVAGVNFYDITPMLSDPLVFRKLIDGLVHRYLPMEISTIAAIDARGFLLGAPLAYELGKKLIPIRKAGKLPHITEAQSYDLEYGSSTVEVHRDAINSGERVLVIDDLIATGGTMLAACQLVERLGGVVVECASVIDLVDLGGSKIVQSNGQQTYSVCSFDTRKP